MIGDRLVSSGIESELVKTFWEAVVVVKQRVAVSIVSHWRVKMSAHTLMKIALKLSITEGFPSRLPMRTEHHNSLGIILLQQRRPEILQERSQRSTRSHM